MYVGNLRSLSDQKSRYYYTVRRTQQLFLSSASGGGGGDWRTIWDDVVLIRLSLFFVSPAVIMLFLSLMVFFSCLLNSPEFFIVRRTAFSCRRRGRRSSSCERVKLKRHIFDQRVFFYFGICGVFFAIFRGLEEKETAAGGSQSRESSEKSSASSRSS